MFFQGLVLSGGGSKGYAYLGILQALENMNPEFLKSLKVIGGTSIGAFYGALISIGFTSTHLSNVILNISAETLLNPNIEYLTTKFGVDNFLKSELLLQLLFMEKGFDKDITFIDHFKKTGGIILLINACCLNSAEEVIFSKDNTPNMRVIDAIKASMCFPLLFTKCEIDGLTYVDGGILNNFLLKAVSDELRKMKKNEERKEDKEREGKDDKEDKEREEDKEGKDDKGDGEREVEDDKERKTILGINLRYKQEKTLISIDTAFDYFNQIMYSLYDGIRFHTEDKWYNLEEVKVVDLPLHDISIMADLFEMSLELKKNIIKIGYDTLAQFLS